MCMWRCFSQGLLSFPNYQEKTAFSFWKWLGRWFLELQQYTGHAWNHPPQLFKAWSYRGSDLDLSTRLDSLASLWHGLIFKRWPWVTRSTHLEDQATQYHYRERCLKACMANLRMKKVVVSVERHNSFQNNLWDFNLPYFSYPCIQSLRSHPKCASISPVSCRLCCSRPRHLCYSHGLLQSCYILSPPSWLNPPLQ